MRQARLAAGLSLADIARDDVSRTQIHFIEHGRSRPSQRVLELIAERTGRPVSYFVVSGATESRLAHDEESVARQLSDVAARVRRFGGSKRLTRTEREAVKLLELTLRQAVALTTLLEAKAGK
ncbi:MAG TPA: helix-turn-helix transcriptional regulator [Candidatus Dormibacteraeota bacterium]|nr:helix-turn-helix transcriptional regulator [Candidatus Dormibacteraeota bacterium]